MSEKKTPPKKSENNQPDHKGPGDPQGEAIHGGTMSDFGEEQQEEGAARPGGQDGSADAQGQAASSEQIRERGRTEGALAGKQQAESSYQGGQGETLPDPHESSDGEKA